MSMCKIICVTNRALAGSDFPEQLKKVVQAGVAEVILREKDLDVKSYEELAVKVNVICEAAHVPLTLHTYTEAAKRLGIRRIHLPYAAFLSMDDREKSDFDVIGVSTHSVEEAVRAQKAGASYVTAGHVFATDCKRGLSPRGLSFLGEVCRAAELPVYAIGGIGPENGRDCIRAGAAGICLMSSLMKAENPEKLLNMFRD